MIREVQDFPTPGVGFKDITPLLADPEALRQTIGELAAWVKERNADLVLGAEARGFILGAAIAAEAGVGFVPARRPGKLPPETVGASYVLEYGENSLELHPDLIPAGCAGRDPRRRARDGRHGRGDHAASSSSSAAWSSVPASSSSCRSSAAASASPASTCTR